MQRKILNTKYKLHSIPILINKYSNKYMKKHNVLYSISCGCIFAFLLVGISCLLSLSGLLSNKCFATAETIGDSTASITLDTSKLTVNVVPGETGYTSKSITISTNDTESYALTITAPATLKNTKANTTNPWGYAYGQSGELSSMTYTSFDGSTKELESGTESDGSTKTLAFSSTFAEGLATGHYEAEVTLGLTATPKTMSVKWSNGVDSGIEYMQDITIGTEESGFCKSSLPDHASITLKDKRDQKSYTIVKMKDGRCWMTQNLQITGNIKASESDFDFPTDLTLPNSTSGFTDSTISQLNAYVTNNTGYYNWYTATAQAGTSSVTSGSVNTSICPKNWKLPTGNSGGEFKAFANAEGIANSSAGSTKIRSTPYNFAYTGYMSNSSGPQNTGDGYWWSRTAYSGTNASLLYVGSNDVYPGASLGRRDGLAVRCIAAEPTIFTLTFDPGNKDNLGLFGIYLAKFKTSYPAQSSPAGYNGTSYTFTIPTGDTGYIWGSDGTTGSNATIQGWSKTKDSSTIEYPLGGTITIDASIPDVTLYPVWRIGGGGIA